jgi:hypothetical protein
MLKAKNVPSEFAALSMFFLLGSLISLAAAVSLLLPGSFLQPIWRLNPRGHEGLLRVGLWAVVLLFATARRKRYCPRCSSRISRSARHCYACGTYTLPFRYYVGGGLIGIALIFVIYRLLT